MRALILLVLALLVLPVAVAQEKEALNLLTRSNVVMRDPGLSAQEWSWVREHKTLRLAVWLPMSPPYDITTGLNDYGGINADVVGLIADNLGINIEVIRFPSHAAAVQALYDGEADFIAWAGEPEQQQGLILSDPYSPNQPVEVVNDDTIRAGVKRVAISPSYPHQPVLARYPGAEEVTFSSVRHAMEALAFRRADLFFCDAVTARYLLSQSNLSNLRIRPLTTAFPAAGFAFATAPSMREWTTILNKLLKAIPASENVEIYRRWNGGIPLSLSEKKPVFTSLERKWIREHAHIRVAVAEDNWPITGFDDRGQLRGIMADILTALRLRTGFDFEIRRYASYDEALKSVARGDNDLIAGATQEAIWNTRLLTTRTWLYNSWVMVGRATRPTRALTQRVVSVRGEAPEAWLANQSSTQIERVDGWRQGLAQVMQDERDMLVMPLIVANTWLARKEYASLKILASIDTEPLRFALGASRESWPLITVLNKALINIPPEDLHALTRDSQSANSFAVLPGETALRAQQIAPYAAGLLLLAIAGCLLYRQQRTIRQLRRASDVKSTFLATMSHEIRTPISIIIGMLELMMQAPKQGAPQLLRASWDAAQSLLLLIGNILDVSRIESGRMVLRPERTALRPLLLATAMQFETLAARKGLRLTLEIDAALAGEVLIDALRLRQIVANLLGNAIKFTERGEVTFRAQQEWHNHSELMLRLDVEDTGPGIDAATRQRLFRPWSQGAAVNSAQSSGLGLFICRTLSTMMGGEIALESEPGNGTRVTVLLRLPVITTGAGQAQPVALNTRVPRSLTVLTVDDNPAGQLLLTQPLQRLGHRVVACASGEQALAALANTPVDAVISDCNMPGMSGYQLAQAIRAAFPSLTLFGMTADARPAARDDAKKAGMSDCLFKPVTLADLEMLLASVPGGTTDTVAPAANLPLPAFLEGDQRATFIDLQLQAIDDTLAVLHAWQHDASQPIDDALHRLRGGIQLLGAEALSAQCLAQETQPQPDGVRQLVQAIEALRATLVRWRSQGLQPPQTVLQPDEDVRLS